MQSRQKHTAYFELLEAFQKARGCALCEQEARAVRRYLDSILYENVNDPGVRGALMRSRGYCNRHAHWLRAMGDGLGTAILYRDQAQLAIELLNGLRGLAAKIRRKPLPKRWEGDSPCPACKMQIEFRERMLRTLLEWLSENQMKAAFSESPGLCGPHLLCALNMPSAAEVRSHLIEAEAAKFAKLSDELAEFIRKHDYQHGQEGFAEEGDSWLRAVNLLAGEKDIF